MIRTVLASALLLTFTAASADEYVQGHYNRDGTYVAPHHRTSPNNTRTDNYSSRPNVNPYTGQAGHVDPYQPRPAPYSGYQQPSQPAQPTYQNPYQQRPQRGYSLP